jgi:sigma-B regulation protein RsbU (phosphoserine phosphatase)
MRVLLAEDDPVSRHRLQIMLTKWGHEVLIGHDGREAWQALQAKDAPQLAILDWMMPHMDGVEICRKLREAVQAGRSGSNDLGKTSAASHLTVRHPPMYVILLTAKCRKEEIVEGLSAGADDYVTKPFDGRELYARIEVGRRILELQASLAERVQELEAALAQVKRLRGLLPICAWCHKIRDDHNYWQSVEEYVAAHSEARFSHGICPECMKGVMGHQDAETRTVNVQTEP